MTFLKLVRWLLVGLWATTTTPAAMAAVTPVPGDPLTGSGNVNRTVLTYTQLFSSSAPSDAVDDTSGFGLPADAAAPTQTFEGKLTLSNPTTKGSFRSLRNDLGYDTSSRSPWVHLTSYVFQFVQNGSHLIPAQQGLTITGSKGWNYIVGPGRVWRENGDNGYMRASFPLTLVERNQNCVHNGVVTFLFNSSKNPKVSKVRYQVTQETCMYFKFDMWGQLSATYTPQSVSGSEALKNAHAAEVAARVTSKPFAALATDYPGAGLDLPSFVSSYTAEHLTLYGAFVNGVNYVGGCGTRFGSYAFCDGMRVPSYSTAKSAFVGNALMWLGQQYGSGVYNLLIRTYVPETSHGGIWTSTTFDHASDMATGNYLSSGYEEDEASAEMSAFFAAEPYSTKIDDAIAPFPYQALPGTTWVYQSAATFILTQALNSYLQSRQGSSADIFNAVRDNLFIPIGVSQGGRTTLRTDNSAAGKPTGPYGLFFIPDDIAKIGKFLNNDAGQIGSAQVIDPTRLQESLFRTANPGGLGLPVPDTGSPPVPNTFRYNNLFWSKHVTPAEQPLYTCDFWVPFMSGYGGITVLLLPNGVTYYVFSDNNEFYWNYAMRELNKLIPYCP